MKGICTRGCIDFGRPRACWGRYGCRAGATLALAAAIAFEVVLRISGGFIGSWESVLGVEFFSWGEG